MKKMFMLAAIFVVGLAVLVKAGGCPFSKKCKMPTTEMMVTGLSEKLNLTDDQKPKVAALLQEKMDKMKAAKDQMDAACTEYQTKVSALLTDDQKKKFTTMCGSNYRDGKCQMKKEKCNDDDDDDRSNKK